MILLTKNTDQAYFEIILINRFIEENIPAALSNKDGPCSESSCLFPNIICKNIKLKPFTLLFLHIVQFFSGEELATTNLKVFSIRTTHELFGKQISVWSILVIEEHLPWPGKWPGKNQGNKRKIQLGL